MAIVYGTQRTATEAGGKATFKPYIEYWITTTDTTIEVDLTFGVDTSKFTHPSIGFGVNVQMSHTIGDESVERGVIAITGKGKNGFSSKHRSFSRTYSAQSIYIRCAQSNSSESTYAKLYLSVPAKPSYTISYDANGGTGAPGSQTKWFNETLTLSSVRPTRSGYNFTGWSEGYQPGGSYNANAAATLTAQWSTNTAAIRLEGNGGIQGSGKKYNLPYTFEKSYNNAIHIPKINDDFKLIKEGYYTDPNSAWYTSTSHTSGTTYAEGQNYAWTTFGLLNFPFKLTTLYANWKPNPYTIIFNKNAGKASGEMNNQSMLYDASAELLVNNFIRTGYSFKGWNTDSESTQVIYKDKASVKNLTTVKNGVVNLYAVWELDIQTFDIQDLVCQRAAYGYVKTKDQSIDSGKTYYIQVVDTTGQITYQEVQNPDIAYINSYYEYTYEPADDGTYALIKFMAKPAEYYNEGNEKKDFVYPSKVSVSVRDQSGVEIDKVTDDHGGDSYEIILGEGRLQETESYSIAIKMEVASPITTEKEFYDTISKAYFVMDINADGTAIGMFRSAPDGNQKKTLFIEGEVSANSYTANEQTLQFSQCTNGSYTRCYKIGNIVFFSFNINITTATASYDYVSGLPIPLGSGWGCSGTATGGNNMRFFISPQGTLKADGTAYTGWYNGNIAYICE